MRAKLYDGNTRAGGLADRCLVPVLPGRQLPDLPVYAITPRRGEQPAKVRHALALLAAHFEKPARQGL